MAAGAGAEEGAAVAAATGSGRPCLKPALASGAGAVVLAAAAAAMVVGVAPTAVAGGGGWRTCR